MSRILSSACLPLLLVLSACGGNGEPYPGVKYANGAPEGDQAASVSPSDATCASRDTAEGLSLRIGALASSARTLALYESDSLVVTQSSTLALTDAGDLKIGGSALNLLLEAMPEGEGQYPATLAWRDIDGASHLSEMLCTKGANELKP